MERSVPQTDVTTAAQKFFSCVYRTGQMFGAAHIIDVLRGSNSEKIIQRNHQNLSTYGIGMEHSKKQWLHLSRQFVQQGFLTKDITYGSLKLTQRAVDAMKGEQKVFAEIEAETITYSKGKERLAADYDGMLFERMRDKRKQLADKQGVPPYVIFSDKTLVELAANMPENSSEMLSIHGIGEVKMQRYGNVFLELILKRLSELRREK